MKNSLEELLLAFDCPLLFDGAMATVLSSILQRKLFFPGEVNFTNPDLVKTIHSRYRESGACIVTTNTLSCNEPALIRWRRGGGTLPLAGEASLSAYDFSFRGAALAREVVDRGNERILVAGSIGQLWFPSEEFPPGESVRRKMYEEQISGLISGGVDCILCETVFDLDEAIILGEVVSGLNFPWIASFAFQKDAFGEFVLPSGHSLKDVVAEFAHRDCTMIGANCISGLKDSLSLLKKLLALSSKPVIIQPDGGFMKGHMKVDRMKAVEEFAQNACKMKAGAFGGCCGTDFEFISHVHKVFSSVLKNMKGANPCGYSS